MHSKAFTVTYSGRTNTLHSEVYVSTAFNPSSAPQPLSPKKVHALKFTAIWDTGATGSVITKKVVNDCGLKPIGVAKVHTASGEATTRVYLTSIFLTNKVCIPELRTIEGVIAGDAEMLIGMDVIGHGDVAVTNKDGETTFSFGMPSVECIDFVKQKPSIAAPQIAKSPPKVGRNDPCPCGSGKKYKKCCGK